MKNYLLQENSLRDLNDKELSLIEGGGLVEDLGYGAHYVYDKCCCAWEEVKDWWNSWSL